MATDTDALSRLLAVQARATQEAALYDKFLSGLPGAFQELRKQKLTLQAAPSAPAEFDFAGESFRLVRLGADMKRMKHFRIALQRQDDTDGAWVTVASRYVDQQGAPSALECAAAGEEIEASHVITDAAGARELLVGMLLQAASLRSV